MQKAYQIKQNENKEAETVSDKNERHDSCPSCYFKTAQLLATTSMSHYQSCAGTGYGTCVFKGLSIC